MEMFQLHPELEKTSFLLVEEPWGMVRLVNDERFLWCLVIPFTQEGQELIDLSPDQGAVVMEKVRCVGQFFREVCAVQRLNVASLGNMVPQLHLHVVGRFEDDSAWPHPIWGRGESIPYSEEAKKALMDSFQAHWSRP